MKMIWQGITRIQKCFLSWKSAAQKDSGQSSGIQTHQKTGMRKKSLTVQYFLLLKSCWHFAGERRKTMLVFYAMFLVANIAYMFQPYAIGAVVNSIQEGGDALLTDVIKWLSLYAGLMIVFWIFHGPARVMERRLAYHVKTAYYKYIYDIITKLPLCWHRDHHTGGTVSRMNKSANALHGFSDSQYFYFENVIRFFAAFILMGMVNIYVALGMFIYSFLVFFIVSRFDHILMKKMHEENEISHKFTAGFLDYISNIDNVILFNLRRFTRGRLGQYMTDIYAPLNKRVVMNEVKWFVLFVLVVVGHFVVLLSYIYYHLYFDIPLMIGSFVAIFQYMLRLDGVFMSVAMIYQFLIQLGTDFSAIEDILDDAQTMSVEDKGKKTLHLQRGEIEFKNVCFSYNEKETVFEGLNFKIPAGQKVGLVGPSGAGKTTLIHLLMRFYDLDTQNILIDQQKISEVTSESLMKNIAVIPQDTTLFETNLMENIRYGRLSATDGEVVEASKKAFCHDFIQQTPGGYQTNVGERGVKLSGGQRQRIAIARAILKDAPILILDEATSALDTESEKFIQKSFKTLMAGKTVIAIAHRLSTISHMDRILVLTEGKIIEDGIHDDLIKLDGRYARQWKIQSEGFIGD